MCFKGKDGCGCPVFAGKVRGFFVLERRAATKRLNVGPADSMIQWLRSSQPFVLS